MCESYYTLEKRVKYINHLKMKIFFVQFYCKPPMLNDKPRFSIKISNNVSALAPVPAVIRSPNAAITSISPMKLLLSVLFFRKIEKMYLFWLNTLPYLVAIDEHYLESIHFDGRLFGMEMMQLVVVNVAKMYRDVSHQYFQSS